MRFIGIAGILLSAFMMIKPFEAHSDNCGSPIFPETKEPTYGIINIPRDSNDPLSKALDRIGEKVSMEKGSPSKKSTNRMTCEDEINERRVIYGVVGIFGLGVFFFGGNLINTGRVTGVKEDEDKQ